MHIVKSVACVALSLYVVTLVALYLAQAKLLYFNDRATSSPVAAGFAEASVMRLTTSDDEQLDAWYVAPARGKFLHLYFHGNGGSLAHRGYALRALSEDGGGVLAIDYRGFGGSSGSPSEAGLNLDAEAAYDKARELGFAPGEILLVGESLGSGVAVNLAARREVAGIVLDAPYSSTLEVAADRYWMFPVSLLMRDHFRSDEVIAKVRAPLLIMHGENDRTVPLRYGEKLYSLARAPKEFLRVSGAGHLVMTKPEGLAKLRDWTSALQQIASR